MKAYGSKTAKENEEMPMKWREMKSKKANQEWLMAENAVNAINGEMAMKNEEENTESEMQHQYQRNNAA